jgi:RecA-family ATPase
MGKKAGIGKIYRRAKSKVYDTSYGRVILNPMKKALKGKQYINPEFKQIMEKEVGEAINAMRQLPTNTD